MFYPIYNDIEKLLKDNIAAAKDVQWYNAQYDGTIAATPILFVEFPEPYAPEKMSIDLDKGTIRVRIHVVSKVLTDQTTRIPNKAIQDHEAIAIQVKNLLQNKRPGGDITLLKFKLWQHWHRWQGFMITFVEFEGSLSE